MNGGRGRGDEEGGRASRAEEEGCSPFLFVFQNSGHPFERCRSAIVAPRINSRSIEPRICELRSGARNKNCRSVPSSQITADPSVSADFLSDRDLLDDFSHNSRGEICIEFRVVSRRKFFNARQPGRSAEGKLIFFFPSARWEDITRAGDSRIHGEAIANRNVIFARNSRLLTSRRHFSRGPSRGRPF